MEFDIVKFDALIAEDIADHNCIETLEREIEELKQALNEKSAELSSKHFGHRFYQTKAGQYAIDYMNAKVEASSESKGSR